jgi:hypothetical protein
MPEAEWSPQATKCLFSGSGCELAACMRAERVVDPRKEDAGLVLLTVVDLIFGPPGITDCDGFGR